MPESLDGSPPKIKAEGKNFRDPITDNPKPIQTHFLVSRSSSMASAKPLPMPAMVFPLPR